MITMPDYVKAYLRVPFVGIVWVMDTYGKNRERLKAFMAQPRAQRAFKGVVLLTALVWIAIAVMASDVQRQRLTDAVMGAWSDTQSIMH